MSAYAKTFRSMRRGEQGTQRVHGIHGVHGLRRVHGGRVARSRRSGFTLVELIIAVLVLGMGLVMIAAIFPAGIAQQQFSNDDILGRVVADHALSVIRGKVKPEDFGTFEQFYMVDARSTGNGGSVELPYRTANGAAIRGVTGDWSWKRPGFVFDDPSTPFDEGKVDVFSWEATRDTLGVQPQLPLATGQSLLPIDTTLARATEFPNVRDPGSGDPFILPGAAPNAGASALLGIPYNREKYDSDLDATTSEVEVFAYVNGTPQFGSKEPAKYILQSERTWPQGSQRPSPGQYYWECMFRRFGGKMYVAIMVYRVAPPGGEPRNYSVSAAPTGLIGQPQSQPLLPPLPVTLRLDNTTNQGGAKAVWTSGTDTAPGTTGAFNPGAQFDAWQLPGQWVLDKFNNVHRVVNGRRAQANGPVRFARPIVPVPTVPGIAGMATGPAANDQPASTIDQIWFLPGRDSVGNILVPVFCTVQEL